ncbi:MAG: ABC transporter substrate-binding protein [Catenulisporales bacterium]|nr:ABC transporter substrate-binding protein [Catenulisporales bacterium]
MTGRFAPFGTQAANGLRLWADTTGAELTVLDDESEPAVLAKRLTTLAPTVDLLFGPYSTVLMRAAIPIAERAGRLLFNHGGSGGALSHPGRVVNVLTPARRYAEPFIQRLVELGGGPLYTAAGRGAFGRDVTDGGAATAQAAGITVAPLDLDNPPARPWDLLSAGVYEDDVATVRAARALPNPPRYLCSVAAAVASFAQDVGDPEGIYGVGQWAPGTGRAVDAGMTEAACLEAWDARYGGAPDYPAVQAYAAGVIAQAAMAAPDGLWRAVAALDITTVFGRFRIDADTGEQTGHEAVLTRWHGGQSLPLR